MTSKVKILSNGLTLICNTIKKSKLAEISVGFKRGSLYEKEEKDFGISHLIEHMLFKGTNRFTATQINEIIENTGAETNAYTCDDKTVVYINCKKTDFENMFDVLMDMVQNSTFDEVELEKEKEVIHQEMNMYEDDITHNFINYATSIFYKDTPKEHLIIGYWDTLKDISSSYLRDYFKKYYTPNNTVISVSGNITMEELEQFVNKYYTNNNFVEEEKFNIKLSLNKKAELERECKQSKVLLAFNEVCRNKKEAFTTAIISEILFSGMSSKIYKRVREELGLCYSISGFTDTYKDKSLIGLYFACEYENIDLIVEEVFKCVEEMKNGNFSEEEFNKSKNSQEYNIMKKDLQLTGIADSNVCNYISLNKVSNNNKNLKKIMSVTKQDVQDLSKKLFNKDKYSIVSLKPKNK